MTWESEWIFCAKTFRERNIAAIIILVLIIMLFVVLLILAFDF